MFFNRFVLSTKSNLITNFLICYKHVKLTEYQRWFFGYYNPIIYKPIQVCCYSHYSFLTHWRPHISSRVWAFTDFYLLDIECHNCDLRFISRRNPQEILNESSGFHTYSPFYKFHNVNYVLVTIKKCRLPLPEWELFFLD